MKEIQNLVVYFRNLRPQILYEFFCVLESKKVVKLVPSSVRKRILNGAISLLEQMSQLKIKRILASTARKTKGTNSYPC